MRRTWKHWSCSSRPVLVHVAPRFARSDLIVGAVILSVYLPTIAPGIAGGDSGELVAESCHVGTAHPPGYPLFTILNHLATQYLPRLLDAVGLRPGPGINGLASPAWCANATAAVFGTLAAVYATKTVQLLCSRWGQARWSKAGDINKLPPSYHGIPCYSSEWDLYDQVCAALASGCAGALMAFSPLMWQYSVTAEVFALNNFLLALLCYLVVLYACSGRSFMLAALGAFVGGLALSNQHTSVLFVAPLVGWVLIQLIISRCRYWERTEIHWRLLAVEVITQVLLFSFGLAPYGLLPLAALTAPRPGSWGNVRTVRGFIHHFLRQDYGSLRLYSGAASSGGQGVVERLWRWGRDVSLVQGLEGVVPFLAVNGAVAALLLCFGNFISPVSGSTGTSNEPASSLPSSEMNKKLEDRQKRSVSSKSTAVIPNTEERWTSAPSMERWFLSCARTLAPVSGSTQGSNFFRSNSNNGSHNNNGTNKGTHIYPGEVRATASGSSGTHCGHNHQQHEQQQQLLETVKLDKCQQQQEPQAQWTGSEIAHPSLINFFARCDDDGASAPASLLLALTVYLVVFNWLSNMPLDDPLLYGVHARFWMQPNILVFIFCGVGLYRVFRLLRSVLSSVSREKSHVLGIESKHAYPNRNPPAMLIPLNSDFCLEYTMYQARRYVAR